MSGSGSGKFSFAAGIRGSAWPVSTLVLSIATFAHAGIYDWNYSGASTSVPWSMASNWYDETTAATATAYPNSSTATAAFSDTGTNGKTISLGSQTITVQQLHISAPTSTFTIGTGTLVLTDVVRDSAVAGMQTISSSVTLNGNSTWNIAGGSYLNVTGIIGDASGNYYTLTKNGAGELRFSGANSNAGATTVNEGTLRITASSGTTKVIRNILTVGDGTHSAAVIVDPAAGVGAIATDTLITVNANASLTLTGNTTNSTYLQTVNVAGGSMDLNGGTYIVYNYTGNNYLGAADTTNPLLAMTGGTLSNGTLSLGGFANPDNSLAPVLVTSASANQATISATVSTNGYTPVIQVADGSAAIDLLISGKITGSQVIQKTGAGVLALTNANDYFKSGYITAVNAGTLLANSATGSSTGKNAVSVAGGATLGGNGHIGGVDSSYSTANVTLTGVSGSNANLSPGSVDSNGVSTLGTLTVGDATQNNSVSFANYSQLIAQIGSTSASDLLAVVGALNLNSASNQDSLSILSLPGASVSGPYTLVTFTGTLTGRFDSVTYNGAALPAGLSLEYRNASGTAVSGTGTIAGGSIVLVPEPAALGAVGIAMITLLRRHRRR